MKIYYILLTVCINLLFTTAQGDILAGHCSNCGSVLVGAAKVEFNTIRWEGGSIPNNSALQVLWSSSEFGFTGAADSNKNLDPKQLTYSEIAEPNKWAYYGYSILSIVSIIPDKAPYMGFYFSPFRIGDVPSVSYIYGTIGSVSKRVDLSGKGVADDLDKPALILKVDVSDNITRTNTGATVEDVPVTTGDNTVFTITPQRSQNQLPSEIAEDQLRYVMVEVAAFAKSDSDTSTTECSQGKGSLFSDIIQRQDNMISGLTNGREQNNYYQAIMGEEPQQSCNRYYHFLVSLGKPFQFAVRKQRESSTDHVEYSFFIRGHYDFNPTSTKYPGSHKTFRLRTSSTVTPANPQLTVNITGTGNGRVTSQPAGIDCPTGTCGYSGFSTSTLITLTATPTDSVVTSNNCPSPFNMPAGGKTCDIVFTKNSQPTNNLPTVQTGANLTSPPNNQQSNPTTSDTVQTACTLPLKCQQTSCSGDNCKSGVQTNDARGLRETTPIAATLQVKFLNAGTGSVQLKSGNTVLREIPVNVTEANSGIKINFPAQEGVTWRSNNDDTLTLDASTATQSLQIKPTLTTFSSSGAVGNTQSLGDINFTVTKEIKACIDPIDSFIFPIVLNTTCVQGDVTKQFDFIYYSKQTESPNLTRASSDGISKGTFTITEPGLVNLLVSLNNDVVDVYSWSSNFSKSKANFLSKVNARSVVLEITDYHQDFKYTWWRDRESVSCPDPNSCTTQTSQEVEKPIITLQVTDSAGGKSSVAKIVKTVDQQPPKINSITPQPTNSEANSNNFSVPLKADACDPDNLDETGKSQCESGTYNGINSYKWEIIDNTQQSQASITPDNQQKEIATLNFGTATSISVTLTVTDDDGASSVPKNLTLTKPVANFTVNQNAENVELDGSISHGLVSSHSPGTGKIDSFHYHWSITPSACSDDSTPERTKCALSQPGIYKVKLQITDIGGFKATSEEKEVFVGLPLKTAGNTVFAVDNMGAPLEITDGWFHSGVIADNGTFIPLLTDGTIQVKKEQPVTIRTTVRVPAQYKEQKGTVLIVLGTSGNFMAVSNECVVGEKNTPYLYPEIKLDGTDRNWVNTLVANCYQQVDSLPSVQEVTYQETFRGGVGIYDIYIGIESLHNIFYSPVPLKVEVVE